MIIAEGKAVLCWDIAEKDLIEVMRPYVALHS